MTWLATLLMPLPAVCLCMCALPTQLLFLAGMTITIGVQATVQFFSRRKNRKVSQHATLRPDKVLAAADAMQAGRQCKHTITKLPCQVLSR